MKQHAEDRQYIIVPASMKPEKSTSYAEAHANLRLRNAYVERARYPEVCKRASEIAVGKALSKEPKIEGATRTQDALDDIWADGQDFDTNLIGIFEEALQTRAGGLYIAPHAESREPVITRYPAEAVVNWRTRNGKTVLVVLEEEVEADEDDIFSHEKAMRRTVLALDDAGKYYQQIWLKRKEKSALKDTRRKSNNARTRVDEYTDDWELQDADTDDGRIYPTRGTERLDEIPFIPLCGWKLQPPPLNALAMAARDYFRASAEYANIMWWSATPQPIITFGENGGWWTQDEFSPEAPTDGATGQQIPEMSWGSMNPWLLRDGKLELVAADASALAAHKDRLEELKKEMGGLGARAFNNASNANQTAETERLQQQGETAVIWLIMREIQTAITKAVNICANWRLLPDDFRFSFSDDISFEPFDLSPIRELLDLRQQGFVGGQQIVDYLIKVGVLAPGTDFEQLQDDVRQELEQYPPQDQLGFGFDGFGDGGLDTFDDQDEQEAA